MDVQKASNAVLRRQLLGGLEEMRSTLRARVKMPESKRHSRGKTQLAHWRKCLWVRSVVDSHSGQKGCGISVLYPPTHTHRGIPTFFSSRMKVSTRVLTCRARAEKRMTFSLVRLNSSMF